MVLGASTDTIVAIATGAGEAGVGIVRLSGSHSIAIAKQLTCENLTPRHAHYCEIKDTAGEALDQGLVITFPGPRSFTGEDTAEIQCHGSPVLLELLVQTCVSLGARYANPGEFSQRAFLNGKMDLAQAEAVADLISSGSEAAMRSASKSLRGQFSEKIDSISEELIGLRVYLESAIDFPEEEIDFLSDPAIVDRMDALRALLARTLEAAHRGRALHRGLKLVIAGAPNAGKSSLMNQLVEQNSSIVTEQAGTTRDLVRERLTLDGLPVEIVDTAGIRQAQDVIEKEGIRRAQQEIQTADRILIVVDDQDSPDGDYLKPFEHAGIANLLADIPTVIVRNKCDLSGRPYGLRGSDDSIEVSISAKSGAGIDLLRTHLLSTAGFDDGVYSEFSARARHVSALEATLNCVESALQQITLQGAGELAAEDLRRGQEYLAEIVGRYTTDDLLGEIFSRFCIGK